MSYSPKELKAINLFMEQNDCVVQLSTKPTIYFRRKKSGKEFKRHLPHLVSAYDEFVKADRHERARANREAKRNEQKGRPYKEQYQ